MIFSYVALAAVVLFLARFAIKQFTNKNQEGTQESLQHGNRTFIAF
jgi:hypothetical protein